MGGGGGGRRILGLSMGAGQGGILDGKFSVACCNKHTLSLLLEDTVSIESGNLL